MLVNISTLMDGCSAVNIATTNNAWISTITSKKGIIMINKHNARTQVILYEANSLPFQRNLNPFQMTTGHSDMNINHTSSQGLIDKQLFRDIVL